MRIKLATLKSVFSGAKLTYTFVIEKAKAVCAAMPDNPCAGASFALACFPNVAYYVCQFVKMTLSMIVSVILQAANMALEIVEGQYLNANMIRNSQLYYDYYYSRATHVNELGHAEWNSKALEAIRLNMKDQHMQMKFQLQERHKDIANHIGQDVREIVSMFVIIQLILFWCTLLIFIPHLCFSFASDCRHSECIR